MLVGDKMPSIIETERLILRTWKTEDAVAYYRINQDLKVIEFLRGALTMEEVNEFIQAVNSHNDKYGYTLWATQLKDTGELIGFIGLYFTSTDWEGVPFAPSVDIGWRLGSQYWGKGYATEGAKACLDFGFNTIGLSEIVSFTVPANVRSIRVMEKIGLERDLNGNFAHPKLSDDHPLSQQILFRLAKKKYFQNLTK